MTAETEGGRRPCTSNDRSGDVLMQLMQMGMMLMVVMPMQLWSQHAGSRSYESAFKPLQVSRARSNLIFKLCVCWRFMVLQFLTQYPRQQENNWGYNLT